MATEEIRVFQAPYVSRIGTPWLIQGGWRTDSGSVGVEQWLFAFDASNQETRKADPFRRVMRAKETIVDSLALKIDLAWILDDGFRVAGADLQVMLDDAHKARLAAPRLESVGTAALVQLAVRINSCRLLKAINASAEGCESLKSLLNEIVEMQELKEDCWK